MLQDLKSQLAGSMQSVQNFLQRPISVAQGGVTLGQSKSSVQAEKAREAEAQRQRGMRRELYQLMERHSASRKLMRCLDAVERTLRRGGFGAVEVMPVRVIGRALEELERLVWDWSPQGLAELRSRMAILVKSRAEEARRDAESTAAMELDNARPADVSEVEHADYEEMERSWAGHVPAPGNGSSPTR